MKQRNDDATLPVCWKENPEKDSKSSQVDNKRCQMAKTHFIIQPSQMITLNNLIMMHKYQLDLKDT